MLEAVSRKESARRLWLPVTLLVLCAVALVASLKIGSVVIGWSEFFAALMGEGSPMATAVVLDLRLPRALSALVVGGGLALAGALMQVLLRNPLADPYVLGTSGGAAVMVLLVLILGMPYSLVPVAASAGALLSMGLLLLLVRGSGDWSSSRLLLTGIVLASGWGALISFLLSISEARQIQGMLFWLMGDLQPQAPGWWRSGVVFLTLLLSFIFSRDLNLLAQGDLRARSLGLPTKGLRLAVLLAASVLTAAAVTLAGPIGFIGLVVPHMMRLLVGSDHRILIPCTVLAGGALLVFAELLARVLFAPQQLPVGVITAFVGIPIFLLLLQRSVRQSHS